MLRQSSIRALAFVAASLLATAVAAQPTATPKKQPTQEELARAREHFKAAEAAKQRHDYKTAADKYLAAYELFPDPEFFFDCGEVYRLAGDEVNALTYYQKYLDLEPGGRGAPVARSAVTELRRSLDAKKAEVSAAAKRKADDDARRKADDDARRSAEIAAQRTADEAAAKRSAEIAAQRTADEAAARRATGVDAQRRPDEEARRKADDTKPTPGKAVPDRTADLAQPSVAEPGHPAGDVHAAVSPAPSPGRPFRLAGLAAGGAGVVGLAVGIGFGLHAKSISDEATHWDMFHQARYDEGQAAQRNMYILTGIGAAAIVAGGVLYYLGYRADAAYHDSGALTFTPTLAADRVAFVATGRF
jgi:hypothetical protein